ncbi:MAG: AprI/Inh family metalloprotease inhibitor [Pseudomonadota bacterium]
MTGGTACKGGGLAKVALVLLAGAVMVSGCTRTSPFSQGQVAVQQPQPAPLQPAPQPSVKEGQLAPVTREPTPPPQSTELPAPEPVPAAPKPEPVQVASAESSGQPVTRQALVGAWTVSTGAANCQLFLALTKWSGGFRAAPRGCGATGIKDVAAWDVKGNQVVLVSNSGQTLASLSRTGEERYNGSVNAGGSITFSR